MKELPRVTAVMPTTGTLHRHALAKIAIQCFLDQTYPGPKRLLILNHGTRYGFPHPDVYEHVVTRPETLGELRNLAFDLGQLTAEDYLISWDDDDWHAPNRLNFQMGHLLIQDRQANALTQYITVDTATGLSFARNCRQFTCGACCGTILCRVDPAKRYPALDRREDSEFAMQYVRAGQFSPCPAPPEFYIRLCHDENISGRDHILNPKCGRRSLTEDEKGHVRRALARYGLGHLQIRSQLPKSKR